MFCYPFEQVAKSKKEAKRLGLRYYYTGKPCKRGHWSRRSKTSSCMECERIRASVHKAKNPDVVKRNNAEGWKRKKARFWADDDYREQSRHQAKMKMRRYRADPKKQAKMRLDNTEQKKAEYKRKINKNGMFTWTMVMRGMLKRCMERGHKKQGTFIEELGYTPMQLKVHIESLFTEGMSWENKGEWQIDHVRPICTFPANTDPSIVNALSNLRPLWADENNRRSRKWQEKAPLIGGCFT